MGMPRKLTLTLAGPITCDPVRLSLLHLNDVVRPPGLVEEWLQRPVESKEREPAFGGDRLDPVLLLARGSVRTEVDIDRAVGIRLRPGVGGADEQPFPHAVGIHQP